MTKTTATLAVASFIWIAPMAHGQTAPPQQADRAKVIESAREIIDKARFCNFITLDRDRGHAQARIMAPTAPDADMNLWIATNSLTRKVGQIRADPRVTLTYFDSEDPSYVTIFGTAEIIQDPAEKAKRWKDEWAAFYPDGPTGDDFTLIRVVPTRLEIVSESRGFTSDPKTWLPAAVEFR